MLKKVFIVVIIAVLAIFAFRHFGVKGTLPKAEDIKDKFNIGTETLKVPDGFQISLAAKDLDNPRVLTFDSKGRILVSETKVGRVSVLEDKDKNGDFETKRALIDNLKSPHGLAFYEDGHNVYLYIAETNQVTRYVYSIGKGEITNKNAGQNIAFLPEGGEHFTRTIAFGPNFRTSPIIKGSHEKETTSPTKLYISVGSSCDTCLENDWKRAAILESDPEGSFTAEFAGGLRNAVFFTFHPETHEIWATEMGRDGLGDHLPPDEINIVKAAGPQNKFGARRYGWPFCYGHQVTDKTFKPNRVDPEGKQASYGAGRTDIPIDCQQTEPATIELPAHSAPLGLAFITNPKWPKEWQNNLLVAYHGSSNRQELAGYKIVKLIVDKNGKVSKTEDFITGWLQTSNQVLGRPVDLKFGPDGALYISDDAAGLIYRVIPH